MKLDELHGHPAYQALTAAERAAVDARLRDWHLDAEAVAATTGGLDTLEAADLRFWLASTASRPWDMISLCDQPEQADAIFSRLLEAAPGVAERPDRPAVVDQVRDLCRALIAAEATRTSEGFVRDEQLAALDRRLTTVEALESAWGDEAVLGIVRGVGVAGIADALLAYRRETSGVRGLFERARKKLQTHVFDLVHASLYVTTGTPDHEGHYVDGVWKNWTANYQVRPAHFRYPDSEQAICEAVANAENLRVVGGGHSFNDGPLCHDTMLSLDRYQAVLAIDTEAKTARVQGGIRLRDLNKVLEANGLGLPVLGSTDAQSIAGLIATDLHGTGRDFGFLSERVRSLRVVDAAGQAQTVTREDPLFRAIFGAIGSCGVVIEVELELVDAFRMEKATQMVDRVEAEANIETLLAGNEHLSFYYIGGSHESEAVRVHRWNRTTAPLTHEWEKHKTRNELSDFAISAYLPRTAEVLADADEDSWLSNTLAPDDSLVMPGSRAFGRKLFYRHDEIEFAVPFAGYQSCLREVMDLLRARDFFSVVEVRFTPDRSHSLIGPGAGRRSAYIELATPLSQAQEGVFAAVEEILRAHEGAPHLGKKCSVTAQDMLEIHGQRFVEFSRLRAGQDPGGKFLNAFSRRVFLG